MATTRRTTEESSRPRRPAATTPEARENQLIALAYDLAEKQLRAGTASSQVMTQLIKAGTERERLERERLARENALLEAKREQMASASNLEELYKGAIKAMRTYGTGEEPEDEYED